MIPIRLNNRSFISSLQARATSCLIILAGLSALLIFTSANAADSDPTTWKWNNPKDLGIDGLQHRTFYCNSMDCAFKSITQSRDAK